MKKKYNTIGDIKQRLRNFSPDRDYYAHKYTDDELEEYAANYEDAIWRAAHTGDFGELDGCIEDGYPVNARDEDENTPLFYAVGSAGEGNCEIIKRLLKRGAKVNVYNEYGACPLLGALNNKYYDAFKLLLDKGADPNEDIRISSGGRGRYVVPILLASIMKGDLQAVKILVEHGATVDTRYLAEAEKLNHFKIASYLRQVTQTL